ncbi:MAG: hypothetical protein JRG96_05015 [Deltaproteobacteria bacterium]|nr:hypothetical protein [Deltaproteobacteria bacterium]MBW2417938.1 hypothetical protein [Deltaproteobacteria bacterium]
MLSMNQLALLQERLNLGFERSGRALQRALSSADLRLEVRELRCRAMADFSPDSLCGGGDVAAGVVLRFDGGLRGTALFAMEPEAALGLARGGGPDREPIAFFTELGGTVLSELLLGTTEGLDRDSEMGPPQLEESSLMAIMASTHAPSDTLILTMRADLVARDRERDAFDVHLMLEPKLLHGLLGEA